MTGAAMGFPLSPIVANIFMEAFEFYALTNYPLKLKCRFRYVDDIFVIWSHAEKDLNSFLNYVN